jgi:hypothetical protein
MVGVCLRVCVSVCAGWRPAGRAARCHLSWSWKAGPLGRPGTDGYEPGPWRGTRQPGGLGIGADDLPINHQLAADEARLDITLLAMCGATYCLTTYDSREGSS